MRYNYKFIGWTRSHEEGNVTDVEKYHLKDVCNTITSYAGGGIGKDRTTGMFNTTPYILIEHEI